MTSWRHETRLPANQPCFFGYGTDRPRKGDRNACVAFQKNKRDKGWRTEALLRGTIGELCGRRLEFDLELRTQGSKPPFD